MNTRYFILILLLNMLCSLSLKSQILLDESDLPHRGDTQVSAHIDSVQGLTLQPGNAGANVIWNFSNVSFYGGSLEASLDSVRWVAPDAENNYSEADIALKTNCFFYHDMQTHTFQEQCFLNYYKKNSTGLNLYASNYPYAHELKQYRNIFPLLPYGQTKIVHSRNVFQNSVDSILATYIIDTITADAWGNVITLIENFNTIRIHTKETVWDSLYVNGIGELFNYEPNNYYYQWFTKDLGFPVMQINKGVLENRSDCQIARFAVEKRQTSVKNKPLNEVQTAIVIPNPFDSEATINLKNNILGNDFSILFSDVFGRNVVINNNIKNNRIILKRQDLSVGIYFFKIWSNFQLVEHGKFIIQ